MSSHAALQRKHRSKAEIWPSNRYVDFLLGKSCATWEGIVRTKVTPNTLRILNASNGSQTSYKADEPVSRDKDNDPVYLFLENYISVELHAFFAVRVNLSGLCSILQIPLCSLVSDGGALYRRTCESFITNHNAGVHKAYTSCKSCGDFTHTPHLRNLYHKRTYGYDAFN